MDSDERWEVQLRKVRDGVEDREPGGRGRQGEQCEGAWDQGDRVYVDICTNF